MVITMAVSLELEMKEKRRNERQLSTNVVGRLSSHRGDEKETDQQENDKAVYAQRKQGKIKTMVMVQYKHPMAKDDEIIVDTQKKQ